MKSRPSRALFAISLAGLTAATLAQTTESQPTVEKCPREMGTLAVAEPQAHVISGLSRYGLGSPSAMLRMIVQQSGCFAVVERGVAMQNMQQERALGAAGQLQADSNVGGGQLQVADFVMTPAIQFAAETGGAGGSVGNLFGRAGGMLGAIGGLAGGVKFKEAETSLLVADVRSGIQVASAEGKASKMDFSLGGWGWGGLGWAAGGGYSKTPEGKLLAASLLDNFNKIVLSIRDRPTLIRPTAQSSQDNAAQSIRATPVAPPPGMATGNRGGGGALPAGLWGAFNGQFGGGEQGTFSIVVGNSGQVNGIGQAKGRGNLSLSGSVQPDGNVALVAAGGNGAPIGQFNGFINPNTGEMVGTWRSPNGNSQGTFTGKRQ